jgi:DNA polymerase I-like protein with 3'-5' exonuclease and polymerase domains
MGVGKLAMRNDMSVDESSELKKAILLLYPGLKQMYQDMKVRAKNKEPIRTWGGREYFCEEPKLVDGRIREFDYKLVNVLIQGSAADCTKEALIRYHAVKDPSAKIVLNVHDQVTASVPKKIMKSEMEVLRISMESVEFDVSILSEGAISSTNWDELQDYDKRGKVL